MEYCGIDLHAEQSQICVLDEGGEVIATSRVRTSRKALERFFSRDRMRVVMEAGGSSPWVSRLLDSLGHEVVVCSPRRVRLIAESIMVPNGARHRFANLSGDDAPPSSS